MNQIKKTYKVQTFSLLKRLWDHLSRRRRNQIIILLFFMLISGLLEIANLLTLSPFLTVLVDPDNIGENFIIKFLFTFLNVSKSQDLLIPLTLIFIFTTLISSKVRILNIFLSGRLSARIGNDFAKEAYNKTLHQPYLTQVNTNSSSIINTLTNQLSITVGAINQVLSLATSVFIAFCLVTSLFVIDWKVALTATFLLGVSYLFIAFFSKRRLTKNGEIILSTNRSQIRIIQEGLGSIREVILDSNQDNYVRDFSLLDVPMRYKQAENKFLALFPRYALESIGISLIGVLALLITINSPSSSSVVPALGTVALAAQRLLPTLQQTYIAWAILTGGGPAIEDTLFLLDQEISKSNFSKMNSLNKINFKSIYLENISFKYTNSNSYVIRNLNLKIKKGERLGIIGKTGSGKSTLCDILMGLLKPLNGQVTINGNEIYSNDSQLSLFQWRRSIAHVPQTIYLTDSTFAENIAFGVPKKNIDLKRLVEAAKQAQIHEFIESTFLGYQTVIGERGVRLSGGQKQRIGIARALYKDVEVLFLDEATSALDSKTENQVINGLNKLSKNITLITIAHRYSTLSNYDRIINLDNGQIVSEDHPSKII